VVNSHLEAQKGKNEVEQIEEIDSAGEKKKRNN